MLSWRGNFGMTGGLMKCGRGGKNENRAASSSNELVYRLATQQSFFRRPAMGSGRDQVHIQLLSILEEGDARPAVENSLTDVESLLAMQPAYHPTQLSADRSLASADPLVRDMWCALPWYDVREHHGTGFVGKLERESRGFDARFAKIHCDEYASGKTGEPRLNRQYRGLTDPCEAERSLAAEYARYTSMSSQADNYQSRVGDFCLRRDDFGRITRIDFHGPFAVAKGRDLPFCGVESFCLQSPFIINGDY